ncbi:hypothetical protein AhyVDH1_040 [Aeromonas phage AhyVDH1]|nr:hypothetical protein AhyVDH1_040 [Aeromonas phage AhyVDH1]
MTDQEIYTAVMENAMKADYLSKTSGPYKITGYTPFGELPAMNRIKFTNTGTELWFTRAVAGTPHAKDPCRRDKYGVGYMGIGKNGPSIIDSWGKHRRSPAYSTWRSMIWRCYAGGNACYTDVTVCERWHNFQTFCEDIQKLEGYDKWAAYHMGVRPDGIIELDKDLKAIPGQPKQYSPETCCFLTKTDNLRVRWNRPIHPEGVKTLQEADHHPA